MKHIPILFSTAMVQAIPEGRKTMTRRIVKKIDHDCTRVELTKGYKANEIWNRSGNPKKAWVALTGIKCPYGQPGDVLWVRETFANLNADFQDQTPFFVYKADLVPANDYGPVTWKSSIHMPKEACRTFLKVTNIRVERLQDISDQDAIAEGILHDEIGFKDYMADASGYGHPEHDYPHVQYAQISFKTLWQSINGPASWDANPWVWVVEFERTEMPDNFLN